MITSKIIRAVLLAGPILLVAGAPASFAAPPDVQILTYGIHYGGQVVYRYQVRNNSASSIYQVGLGLDVPGKELPAAPWNAVLQVTNDTAPAPAGLCKPFANMACAVTLFQFDYMSQPMAVVTMKTAELSRQPPPATFSGAELIRPGTTSSVAEICVPQRAGGYLSAAGTVSFLDANTSDSSGKPIVDAVVAFTPIDKAPPSISGNATAEKVGGMLAVTVQLQVADDMDPSPEVALVSVTANEPLKPQDVDAAIGTDARALRLKRNKGRVYYLTYRAIDGSENSATTVIQVPGEL